MFESIRRFFAVRACRAAARGIIAGMDGVVVNESKVTPSTSWRGGIPCSLCGERLHELRKVVSETSMSGERFDFMSQPLGLVCLRCHSVASGGRRFPLSTWKPEDSGRPIKPAMRM